MEKKNYKDTLNLPQTDFPMKASLAEREPLQVARWEKERLYERMVESSGKKRYVMHDGPPYANGRLHLGTILNKILKDIVVKYRNMSGWRCEFVPGWDCHGLPIELEVDKDLGHKKRELPAVEVRKKCAEHAQKFVGIQRDEFKRLGVLARWDRPYVTMAPVYEAAIVREFGKFVKDGQIYKGKKPVYWCAKCRTALAEAEVEYADHRSPSIYVKFRLVDDNDLRKKWRLGSEPVYIVIWTTTPWTIPANLGIALNPGLPYVAAKVGDEVWILAEGLLDTVMKAVGRSYSTIVGRPKSKELEHKKCRHPLLERDSLVILGEHVTLDAGTGAVHTAPGHGHEDYDVGQRYGLDALAPLDDGGRFTEEAGLPWLTGVFVEDANLPINKKLEELGALIKSEDVSHSYPHCWRCKRPVIFRSTDQWFIPMDRHDLRKKTLKEIKKTKWVPPWGEQRITGMMASRPDWCISRQRIWGVPVVALVCDTCGTSHTTRELVEKAADLFEKEGADAWYVREASDFKPKGFKCPSCGEKEKFKKEPDILDVWFESGVSFAAVLEAQEDIMDQADLYLEGSDQHRGWFHTSLITSVATRGRAPYKCVLTHGFVVDGEGKKYSKSARNYIPPEKLIGQHGAEILRLWVAAEDYRLDIRFSDEIFNRCIEAYRKLRNTARYMLGNLSDFDPDRDMVRERDLQEMDRWALAEASKLVEKVLAAYESFDFHVISHALNRFCTVEMSAYYLDILKDRLYTEKKDGALRRSAQTALWKILDSMVRIMAPIFSFTADEVWLAMRRKKGSPDSVFLSKMPEVEAADEKLLERWERLMEVRQVVTKALENARADRFIGNSLLAKVTIECDRELAEFMKSFGETLPDILIVSAAELGTAGLNYRVEQKDMHGLVVSVEKAPGGKCERCWKCSESVGRDAAHPTICARCAGVVKT